MKKLITLSAAATLFAVSSDANIKEFVIFDLVSSWDAADTVEFNGGDEALDSSTTTPGLFESIYGDISGNTICRSDFKTAVADAYTAEKGGVIDFETFVYSPNDWIHPTLGTPIDRTGADAIQAQYPGGTPSIIINRGTNWWFEGDAITPYKGKQTGAFDGTGPSGPDRTHFDEIFFFVPQSPSSNEAIGANALGQTTSFDLDFNPADEVVIVGFAALNWNGNFQSQQDVTKVNAFYPNMHAIATFTNGSDSIDQMSVGLTSVNPNNDYYFGFEAPEGYFLDRLQFYAIGNNSRVFVLIDDLGFVQASPAGPAVLAAEDVTITPNGTGVDVSFQSDNSLLYTLEESSDLNPPWCDIQGPVSGTGGVMTFNVDPAPADGKAFYRVRSE